MKLINEISKVLEQFCLSESELSDLPQLLMKIKLQPMQDKANLPGVYHKETNTYIAQADDFFISVLVASAHQKGSPKFDQLTGLISKIVSKIADSDQKPLQQWILDTHPMIKLIDAYAVMSATQPFFYDNAMSHNLLSIVEQYSAYAHSDVVASFFEKALEAKCIEFAAGVLPYNVVRSGSEGAVRAFFANILQDMPGHYFVARKEPVIEIARRFAKIYDLSKIPLDVRNSALSISEYVTRKSGANHDVAQACIYLFNEKNFTELFDFLPDNANVSDADPAQVLLY